MKVTKILLVSAEPKNFVPVELEKAAKKLGVDAEIIDISKTVLIEELCGNSPETFELTSCAYMIAEDGKLTPIKVDAGTVIIPRLNEYHTLIKLGILTRFQKQGAYMLNTPESMELCNDKLMTQIILNSAGIKTPYSVMIQGLDEIEKVVTTLEEDKKIKYPFVIKTFRGTHGIGVMKVDSRSSLVSVAQLLSKEGIDFMLQEFCEHERSARIIMLGKDMLAANLRGQPKDKDEFRTNSHLGSETEVYEPTEDEMAVARRIVELFGCNFCAVDYLITKDKQIIVLEVNGSPGLENIQKDYPDKNLAELIIKYVTEDSGEAKETTVVQTEPTVEPEVAEVPGKAINETEIVSINRIVNDVEARIDTGATFCSLHVDKIEVDGESVKFTRGDITYKVPVFKTARIRNAASGTEERPIVKLDLTMRDTRLNQIEFTLNDRSNMKYEVLIGRNAIQALGLPVAVEKDGDNEDHRERDESKIVDVEEE